MFKYDSFGLSVAADAGEWCCTFLLGADTVGTLRLTFNDDLEATSASLERPHGTSATELSRFPWAHWIGLARDDVRGRLAGKRDQAVVSEIFEVAERMTGPRRPGRAGRGDDHYAEVLRRYRQLKAKGETQPIVALQRIYAENGEEWSRDTIAGWVKRAKKIEQERQAEAGKGHRP